MTIETADLSDSDEEIFNDFETYKKEHSFAKLSIPTLSAGSSEYVLMFHNLAFFFNF